jgi:hypothetical protein
MLRINAKMVFSYTLEVINLLEVLRNSAMLCDNQLSIPIQLNSVNNLNFVTKYYSYLVPYVITSAIMAKSFSRVSISLLFTKILAFCGPNCLSPYLQDHSTILYSEPVESSPFRDSSVTFVTKERSG